MNRVELRGRIGADPVIRMTPSGRPVLVFRVGTAGTVVDPEATHPQSLTTWHRVKVIGKQSYPIAETLKKGDIVGVTGRLQMIYKEIRTVRTYEVQIIASTINGNSTADQ